jgi:hypothetical protein
MRVSDPIRPYPGSVLHGTVHVPGKEHTMRKSKDVQFCIDALRSLQKQDGKDGSERTNMVSRALKSLYRFRRKSNPSNAETYELVREVSEAILKAFDRNHQ